MWWSACRGPVAAAVNIPELHELREVAADVPEPEGRAAARADETREWAVVADVPEAGAWAAVHMHEPHEPRDVVADLPEAGGRNPVHVSEFHERRAVVADVPEDEARAAVHVLELP